jgi:hypothetical protein
VANWETKRSETLQVESMDTTDTTNNIRARRGYVSMSWSEGTRHTVPIGTTVEQFRKNSNIYVCYWTVHNSRPKRYVCGGGRPFANVCLNSNCGQQLEKLTLVVKFKGEKYHANTPVLGWCECICCMRCLASMPLVEGEWRECPGCRSERAHQDAYLMFPLTVEGQAYNIALGKKYARERVRREEAEEEQINR